MWGGKGRLPEPAAVWQCGTLPRERWSGMALAVKTAYIADTGAIIQITLRKAKTAATSKANRKLGQGGAKTSGSAPTQEAIAKAVQDHMAANYECSLGLAAIAHSPEIEAMFAEVDRNLDASEQIAARLLAQD